MGWFENTTCCLHCKEPQSIRAIREHFSWGSATISFLKWVGWSLLGALLSVGPSGSSSRKRRFRCNFCGKEFEAVPDERYTMQRSPNRCNKCGYNLTGNVSGICPECGEKI
jgi:hypothetical protein